MLVGRTFAFVFNWYKEIIAPSLPISSGALQHTAHSSIIKAKIVSLKFFSSANLGLAPKKKQYQSGQYKMQTADRVQNAD